MTSQKNPLDDPLDEVLFRDDAAAMEMAGVHENSVLFYFARSPFFNQSSNNGVVYNQSQHNPKLHHILQTRAAFEGRLKSMSGLEYMIAEQPAEMAPGTGTGVWVIRKQTRRKRQGMEDEITVHGSYFVVGHNIYQAPSVADVLGSKMLSVSTSLNKFISKAATFPEFSPALGHTYAALETAKPKFSDLGQRSKEATPMPDSQTSSKQPNAISQTDEQISNQLLADTINISLRYGDEYMDEAPVTGQPGDFHLSTKVRKDAEKGKLAVPAAGKGGMANKPEPPPPLKTDLPDPVRKGSKLEKSPKTPTGAPKLKRRKSKVNSSSGGGGVSPTT